MRRTLYLILLLAALCVPTLCTHAQENIARQIYYQAESEYQIGHTEEAIKLLSANLSTFNGNLRQSAYRLLALCYLSEDDDANARHYAEQLIRLNNYYSSTDDPARFQDLISQLKTSASTIITTASNQSESVNEAPAPVTIITAEMIEELGYNKNLAQILAAYVPGMAEVTSTSEMVNMSMHGAYASGQEMILIMENGHRLNSRYDNIGPISYSIGTEKIDHIEVLRGPTSSLYGNVALSAVVNIITKSGHTIDGVRARYGYASYGTHRADLEVGTQFMNADISAWASFYQSDGQLRHFGDGEGYLSKFHLINDDSYIKSRSFDPDVIYVSSYKEKPAYDIGLTFKLKGFEFMFNRKNVNKILQHTISYGGYNYGKYPSIHGNKPGLSYESTHADIGYSKQWKKLFLQASVYFDWYDIGDYLVNADSLVSLYPVYLSEDPSSPSGYQTEVEYGTTTFHYNKERTIGGILRAATDYQIGKMKGNVLVGSQFEHFSLLATHFLYGTRYGDIERGQLEYEEMVDDGKERTLSFFIQDKHYFLPKLILNAGFRYDLKFLKNEKEVNTFSPRLALMFVPHERFSLKLSYSEAFADLSFYDRYIFKTSDMNLPPQHLSAIQLTAMGKVPQLHLSYELNAFYNKYTNLLFLFSTDVTGSSFMGRLSNIGLEGTASYAYKRLSASLSLYYCRDVKSENYSYNPTEKMVCGVPHLTFNLHGAWKLIQGKMHEVKLYGHSQYIGRKLNYSMIADDFYVDAKCLFDVGVKYSYRQRLQLSFDCENIFDTDHYICGPNYQHSPRMQRGRTLMASVAYQF